LPLRSHDAGAASRPKSIIGAEGKAVLDWIWVPRHDEARVRSGWGRQPLRRTQGHTLGPLRWAGGATRHKARRGAPGLKHGARR
jgi:hypothetical protein